MRSVRFAILTGAVVTLLRAAVLPSVTVLSAVTFLSAGAFLSASLARSAFAADRAGAGKAGEVEKDEKLPRSGLLSSASVGGYASKTVGEVWGGVDDRGEELAPVSGSVSRLSPREWVVRLTNNSEDTYAVSVELSMFNERGSRIKGDSFSYTLKPGQQTSRPVNGTPEVSEAQLYLRSWRNLSAEKRKREKARAATGAPPESTGGASPATTTPSAR